MLISAPANEVLYGERSILVAAKFLIGQPGVEQVFDLQRVTYFHILFDDHQVILANGAASESLHPGDMALQSIASTARDEILTLFPELAGTANAAYGPTAAKVLKRKAACLLTQIASDKRVSDAPLPNIWDAARHDNAPIN